MTTAVSLAGNLISAKMSLASPAMKRAESEGMLFSFALVEANLIEAADTSMPIDFLKRGDKVTVNRPLPQ